MLSIFHQAQERGILLLLLIHQMAIPFLCQRIIHMQRVFTEKLLVTKQLKH